VLVPKSVAWSDPGRLVGVGSRWAPGIPVVDPLDAAERDQGQYDVNRPIYAGDSAGMLVRADVWHSLQGMDPFDRNRGREKGFLPSARRFIGESYRCER